MLNKAKAVQELMVAWRRDIHAHPELGFKEFHTAQKIADVMANLGYRVRTGVGKTGVVAEMGEGKPVVAIRADMDALPIPEANDVPYKSRNEGVLHACGHDAHVAIALGTAKLLAEEKMTGTVRFLFQPAEEIQDDDGLSGAPRMIEDGAIDGADCVLALHVDSSLKTGEIEIDEFSAAGVDSFTASIYGKGGHGAMPHTTVDPIVISGHVILGIQSIVSRRLWPFDPAVITIGSIHSGQAANVIPDEVQLSGTIRYLTSQVRDSIHAEIDRVMAISKIMGGDYKLSFLSGYPPMSNHPEMVALIKSVAGELIGESKIAKPKPEMGSEDFGYFAQDIPGAMYILGCLIEGDPRRHHDPRFDIDEDCMPIGAAIMAQSTLTYMDQYSSPSD
ncbi:MAG: M20 family metallopeptidase [Anaerolineales bacterium]|nr:M20 family metallopeptidase [Anaerolineales bacterium]